MIRYINTLWPEDETFSLERREVENEYIFIHILTDMITLLDGKTVRLPPGTCICYPPGSHQYIEAVQGGLLHDWAHFSTDFGELAEKFGFRMLTPYTLSNDNFVTEIMQSVAIEKLGGEHFCDEICEMKISELVAKIVRYSNKNQKQSISPSLYTAFSEARTKIHMDYRKPWSIDSMAELVHLSPSRFFFLYKEIFGISPKSDLLNIRMEHAMRLLSDGSLSVKEVSELTGYTNVYHFIRSFKAHTGKTPGKYRK